MLLSGATLYPRDERIGDLIVPRSWALPESYTLAPGRWAMDNGAFNGFDPGAFMRMLERFADRPGCLFVTAPDVVGDAAATLAAWRFWSRVIGGLGLPVAFVAQDGLTAERVPWDDMAALFIGGSTDYKESAEVVSLMAYAKARGMWVHWGRVNGRRRYAMAKRTGAIRLTEPDSRCIRIRGCRWWRGGRHLYSKIPNSILAMPYKNADQRRAFQREYYRPRRVAADWRFRAVKACGHCGQPVERFAACQTCRVRFAAAKRRDA